ncbi:hypothetical protein [Streptomyces phytophilus]|uniref:hypothetical protein n=1 Tax=Streptomyces phytophilus TaxID=722715 RepID=UPI0015F112F0|nr:hypothetical protein [Streptomyces phytophilus]
MNAETIQEKAGRVRAGARAIRSDQQNENERQRVEKRVREISAELGNLEGHLRTAATLTERAGLRFDLSYVEDGYANLARRAEGGLPSNQSFIAAQRKLAASSRRLAAELQEAWASWSQDQLEALPLGRKAMLTSRTDKDDVENRVRELKSAQNPKSDVNSAMVTTFAQGLSALKEILHDVPEVSADLVRVLDKIDRGRLALSDVTDAEISVLRQYGEDIHVRLTREAG